MGNESDKLRNVISRRALLRGAAAVGAAPILLAGAEPSAAGKVSKASVQYRGSPHGSEKCANCSLFVAPSSCKTVAGHVSPHGWCMIWSKA